MKKAKHIRVTRRQKICGSRAGRANRKLYIESKGKCTSIQRKCTSIQRKCTSLKSIELNAHTKEYRNDESTYGSTALLLLHLLASACNALLRNSRLRSRCLGYLYDYDCVYALLTKKSICKHHYVLGV